MLKLKIFTAAIIVAATTTIHSAQNPLLLPPSALSASYSEGAFSSMLNPVFSDTEGSDIAYRFVRFDSDGEFNHFFSVNIFGFDIIYSLYNSLPSTVTSGIDSRTGVYSINRGLLFGNTFGFGAGYSFGRSDYDPLDDYSGWSFGLLLRPFSFISLGAAFHDVDGRIGGKNLSRTDIYSVSIRPWMDYLTIGADYVMKDGDNGKFCYSAEIKGYKDISLSLKYNTDKSFTAGVSLPLFIRVSEPTEITLDYYQSNKSKSSDFKSGGISFNFLRNADAINFSPADNYIILKINGNYIHEREESGLFSKREPVFQDLVLGLQRIEEDRSVTGIILELDSVEFGVAQLQEIRDILGRIKKSGKKVYAVINNSGNREYYLACAADRIFFTPNSTFKISGLSARVYFMKGLLDKAGIKFESFSKGKYKSFSETFTRTGMSDAAKENLTEILTGLNEQYLSAIVEGRKIKRESIEELFMKGAYTPAEAKERGFIDEVMYTDEAVSSLGGKTARIKFDDYIEENIKQPGWGSLPAIAVINVTGSIVSGKGGGSSMSESTGDHDYRHAIDTAFSDPSIKAVVIRIDSGGGSASASDFMWNDLLSAKKKNPKPVVFSFGNTAASGGYYIACTGDHIFAQSGTITGSIGVVAGKVSAAELYSKLGISTETIKLSEFADIFSESRNLTQREQELFQKEIDFIYDRFTGRVIEGRSITPEEIGGVAEGRIHTGDGAKKNRLVNETGGLLAAIEYAVITAEIETDFRIINLPEDGSIIKGVFRSSELSSLVGHLKFIISNIGKYRMLDERALYITPYTIEIE